MAFLIYKYAENSGETIYKIDKDAISVGRLPSNDIALLDPSVSRNHFIIQRQEDGYYIYDNGSSNGTILNGKKIEDKVKLCDQDQITAGKVLFIFSEKEEGQEIKEVLPDELNHIAQSPSLINSLYLDIIFSVAREGIYSIEQDKFYTDIIKLICNAIKAEYGAILLMDNNTGGLTVKASNREKPLAIQAVSKTIIDRAIKNRAAMLVKNAVIDTRFNGSNSIQTLGINSALCAPIWEKEHTYGALYVDRRVNPIPFEEEHLNFITIIANLLALKVAREELIQKIIEEKNITNQIKRFVPIEAVENLLKTIKNNPSEMWNIQEVERTSVMFADIVGFTSLTEKNKPIDIARLLRTFFEHATNIVLSNGGSINKFLGDGFMAIFGTPVFLSDDADRAINSAISLIKWTKSIDINSSPVSLRIGIATGPATGIMVGSPQRLEYTIIGDCVNTASRLQTQAMANQILISGETNSFIKSLINTRFVGEIAIKGKMVPVKVYEVIST